MKAKTMGRKGMAVTPIVRGRGQDQGSGRYLVDGRRALLRLRQGPAEL